MNQRPEAAQSEALSHLPSHSKGRTGNDGVGSVSHGYRLGVCRHSTPAQACLDWHPMTVQEHCMETTNVTAPENMATETLPFVVRLASQKDMERIATLRAVTYGKHMPALAGKLRLPEPCDNEWGCEVMVAASKLDGSLLGTLRTHANVIKPLPLQASIRLPERFRQAHMVEATRLCIISHSNSSLVRSALFKALFQYCEAQKVDFIVAAARKPIDRIYEALLFSDVAEPGKFYPMAHASGLQHRVMCLKSAAQASWSAAQHPLYKFVFETVHPDIDLSMSTSLQVPWSCPETDIHQEYTDPSVRGKDAGWQEDPVTAPMRAAAATATAKPDGEFQVF